MDHALPRRVAVEFTASLLLAAMVVGSGIAGDSLSPTDTGLALLQHALVIAFGLFVLITLFAPVSGCHMNPIVSLVDSATGARPWRDAALYIPAQVLGCASGAVLSNVMFALQPVTISSTDRLTPPTFLGEIVATAGLVLVVFGLARLGRSHLIPVAVAAYIASAIWFTSSYSFANPAITISRMLSDTFAGIAPTSALGFIAAQLAGAVVGWVLVLVLIPETPRRGPRDSAPHPTSTPA